MDPGRGLRHRGDRRGKKTQRAREKGAPAHRPSCRAVVSGQDNRAPAGDHAPWRKAMRSAATSSGRSQFGQCPVSG